MSRVRRMRRTWPLAPLLALAASAWVLAAPQQQVAAPDQAATADTADTGTAGASSLGRVAFADHRDPPAYLALDDTAEAQRALGHAVFNTSWVAAGAPAASRRDGLGPLYIAASCDACHNEGARARGPRGDGPMPVGFVLGLAGRGDDGGDPLYGHVLNTVALPGFIAEGTVGVHYRALAGRYPDGSRYTLRAPQYRVQALASGALAPDTVLRPRMAPQIFGVGLLAAVPDAALRAVQAAQPASLRGQMVWHHSATGRQLGRFDWQNDAVSVADQTARAFAREMGLSSSLRPHDDCTKAQAACRHAAIGGTPEVEPALLAAVLRFQDTLAVPAATPLPDTEESAGARLFAQTGCAQCHRSSLPVQLDDHTTNHASDHATIRVERIAPWTDLLLHDMGAGLADRRADGQAVASRWRTAPLWGLQHALGRPNGTTGLLHDGRARSVEEAILWHDGQARFARLNFQHLPAVQCRQLLHWVEAR